MQKTTWTTAFRALCIYLVVVYLTGGSAREDVQSLVILRPVSAAFAGFAVWNCSRAIWLNNRNMIVFATSILLANTLYIIPLPGSVWTALSGRDLIASVDTGVFGQSIWRALAINPNGGWNAFFATLVPFTVLMLAIQIDWQERYALMILLIGLGLVSGLLGMLQSIGNHHGSLYFYQITNNGSAVGLLSNRNHQAVLLASLFPMLAVYAASCTGAVRQARFREWLAIVASAFLVPLILVTGSRAGFILSGFATLAGLWLYWRSAHTGRLHAEKSLFFRWGLPAVVAGTVIMGFLTFSLSRAKALQRLLGPEEAAQTRSDFWQSAIQVAFDYFPFGTGPGSFVQANIAHEADISLGFTYLNHAHNDWLELVLSYGAPAILILALLVGAVTIRFIRVLGSARNPDQTFQAMGLVILTTILGGSIVDYPIRAPLIATLTAASAVWCFQSNFAKPKNVMSDGKGWNPNAD